VKNTRRPAGNPEVAPPGKPSTRYDRRSRDVLVIGVGNDYRGDDAAGLEVVRAIQGVGEEHVTTIVAGGDGTALMDLWNNAQNVILVDAVCSGKPPGTTVRYDLRKEALPARFFRTSTHAFGIAEAVALARAFKSMPDRLILFGIEGREFRAGQELSRQVREAIPPVVDSILCEVRHIRQRGEHAGCTGDGNRS
jgi:hydrogenase maturation protease